MRNEDILKKLGEFSIGPIVGAFLGLISTPLFTYFVSPEEYGKSSMFTVAITVLQLVIFLGMDQAFVKRFYETSNKSALLTNSILPSLTTVILIEIVIFVFFNEVSFLLFDSYDEIYCVYALMFVLPALALERFAMLFIRMEQKGFLYSSMTILLKLMIIIVTVSLFLCYEKSFRSIVYGQVVSETICVVVLLFVCHGKITFSFNETDKKLMIGLLRFGLPLIPTTIIGWTLNGMDKVMIRTLCEYSDLGLYSVAVRIAAVLTIIQACFTNFWVPLAHQWRNEGEDNNKFVFVGRMIMFVMAMLFVTVLLFKDIIFLLFKPEYYPAAQILPFLMFTPIMYTVSEVTVMGIYFTEKTVMTIIVSVISAVVNLSLNIILIPILGASGAAIATGFSYIVFFWCRTIISRKLWFDFPLTDYIIGTVVLIIASTVNTFFSGVLVYVVNVACLGIIFLYYRNELHYLLRIIVGILKGGE